MKTTVELPDDLVVEAKKLAAETRQPLRMLIEKGLRAQLALPQRQRDDGTRVKIQWLTVDGGLPEGLDIDDRASMREWLNRER